MKKKWVFVEIAIVVLATTILAAVMVPKFIASQNINTPRNFPDEEFRRNMEAYVNVIPGTPYSARNAYEASIEAHVFDIYGEAYINVKRWRNIQSLKGIEYFSGFKLFGCGYVSIKEVVDLSTLLQLKQIRISESKLPGIILPNTKTLIEINVFESPLSHIDISVAPNLNKLWLFRTSIQFINLNHNTQLQQLLLPDNQIETIDLTANTNIKFILFTKNPLTEIILPISTPLEVLHLNHTELNSIPELRPFTTLRSVDLRGIPIHEKDWDMIYSLEESIGKEVAINDNAGIDGGLVVSGVMYDGKEEQWITTTDKDFNDLIEL